MSTSELNRAKSLIQQKRYAEARDLLRTIHLPVATKWLAKLDDIDPPKRMQALPTSGQRNRAGVSSIAVMSALVIAFLGLMIVYQQNRIEELSRLVSDLATDVSTVRIATASFGDDIATLNSVVNGMDSDISQLGAVINSHASDINSLSYNLSRVASVANNANRYAHSHTYSDAALKVEISAIEDPLERLLSIRGIAFTWNNDAFPDLALESGRDYGVVAQELAAAFPELVEAEQETGLLRVDYEGLIPVFIEAIREQQRQIQALRAMIDGEAQ
ncbi:MAG: tail fiber domain-containing protein [Chloroflexi bacterium]|nr:tail fiber domain-containing protein [Chloroflexota bacterium]